MKTCSRCQVSKSLEKFNKASRNKDGLHAYCRDCCKEHYNGNKDRHSVNVRKASTRRLKAVRQIITDRFSKGCVDCGLTDIRVLEFDHLHDKIDNVSSMVRRGNAIAKVIAEINKCEVRCKNCHAIKTLERLGRSWHDAYAPVD